MKEEKSEKKIIENCQLILLLTFIMVEHSIKMLYEILEWMILTIIVFISLLVEIFVVFVNLKRYFELFYDINIGL